MKVLLVADNLVAGGRERRMLEFIKGLLERGHSVTLVLFRDAIHYKEIFQLPVELIVFKKRFRKDVFIYFQLFTICKRIKPDLIHTWGGIPSIMAVPVALFCRVKLVNGMIANSQCPLFTKDWFRSRLSFPFSTIIISNSKIGLIAYGVSSEKGIVIPNGFNLARLDEEFNRANVFKELELPDNHNTHIVGMVASINWRKDYPTYINAALEILGYRQDVYFLVIGDGQDREKVEAMIPDNLKRNFRFTGNRQGVDRFIRIFNVGVLATFAEGISNSIMEYMAFEKPVVVSDVPGNRELVAADSSGYLVEVGDEKAMADRINILISDDAHACQMGKIGKQIIIEKFTVDKMTDQYLEVYKRLNK